MMLSLQILCQILLSVRAWFVETGDILLGVLSAVAVYALQLLSRIQRCRWRCRVSCASIRDCYRLACPASKPWHRLRWTPPPPQPPTVCTWTPHETDVNSIDNVL